MSTPININSEVQRRDYTATASQTIFDAPFPFFENADVKVVVNGVEKSQDTDYTLTGAGTADGGSITFGTGLCQGRPVCF